MTREELAARMRPGVLVWLWFGFPMCGALLVLFCLALCGAF